MKTQGTRVPRKLLLFILTVFVAAGSAQAQLTYYNSGGQITITGYNGQAGDVVIPETIEGLPVTEIGYRAFQSRTDLTSVTMPNTLTRIGGEAFSCCTGLTDLTIPDSVTNLGGHRLLLLFRSENRHDRERCRPDR